MTHSLACGTYRLDWSSPKGFLLARRLVARAKLQYNARVATSKASKLTLVVDPAVVRRAKSYASAHDTSVSSLVEAYLSQLTATEDGESIEEIDSLPPTTRALFGALRGPDSDSLDERQIRLLRLTEKYLHD